MIKFFEITNFFSKTKFTCSIALLTIIILQLNCVPYYRHHDQKKAAEAALNFSINAFIKKDFEKAHSFLRNDTAKEFDVVKLEELVTKMHPTGEYPFEIKATEFEIIPNSGMIRIYLQGKGKNNETHYYRILTVSQDGIYKIGELYRNDKPYPKNQLVEPLK